MTRVIACSISSLLVVLGSTVADGGVSDIEVTSSIVGHDATSFDGAGTRPALFAYTGRTTAEADAPVTVSADVIAPSARLDRDEVVPGARADAPLTWLAAGRAAPIKVNAQDSMPVFLVVAARANPYADTWYQRQETATDLWHWGGLLAGSRVSGTQSIENAVVGMSSQPIRYPSPDSLEPGGALVWEDRHLVRTAVTTDHDPATGQTFDGTFAVNLAMPSLKVVGGDGVFTSDTTTAPLVLPLPVKPSGLAVFTNPPAPPGVSLTWERTLNFTTNTMTVRATVKAGSVWPESGVDAVDPSIRTWEWRPWVLFPGWDYGDLVNGGPTALRPPYLRPDGTVEVRSVTSDGVPALPPGMLDLNLPVGGVLETATGDRAVVHEPVVEAGVRLGALTPPNSSGSPADDVTVVTTQGVLALDIHDGETEIGQLSLPTVRIDGDEHALDEAVLLDSWVSSQGRSGSIVAIYETGGVFFSVVLVANLDGYVPYAAYYLWDAHSSDGALHDVRIRTTFDPAIGGDEGDSFVEAFYTQQPITEEGAVPQGVLDFPVGAFVNGWLGSLPTIDMRDDAGIVRHLQLWPNQPNTNTDALETFAYLIADHGSLVVDPDAEIADRESVLETDVMFTLVNGYRGRLWDRGMLAFQSYFYLY